ncbi:hypothetical protein ZWY2020_044887 [Hordeum vulgare]|nr:hypothetical protein ZWY2020_044887 [Hordeum vulgare]
MQSQSARGVVAFVPRILLKWCITAFMCRSCMCACQFGLKSTNKMKKTRLFLSFNDHLEDPRFKSASLHRNKKSKEKLKSDNVSCVRSGAPLIFLHVDEPIPQACFEVELPGESVAPR